MSLEDLSYEHEEQLKSFLKFFRSKRNYQIQEVEACFADQLDVLHEDMYTKDEIKRSFDSLCTAVRSSVLTDLQMTANMSMLVLRQLLEEAEASEIDMDLDMTIIEDQSLLAEASKVSIDAPTRKRRNQKNVKLGGIRDEHQRMMNEFEGVKKQNAELLDAKSNLEKQCKEGKKKRRALRKEIAGLRDQVDRLNFKQGSGGSNGGEGGSGGGSSGGGGGKVDDASDGRGGSSKQSEEGTSSDPYGSPAADRSSSGGRNGGSSEGGARSDLSYDGLMEENQRLRGENSRLAAAMVGRGGGGGGGGGGSNTGSSGGGTKRGEEDGAGRKTSSNGDVTPIKSAAQVISGDLQVGTDIEAISQELKEAKVLLAKNGVDMEDERQRALEKVMKMTQFKQMKKMINAKNEQVEALRSQLREYAPEEAEHGVRK
tara:strand:+ start:82 stop:1362 length:1281 start_codon:yes stop_codon:yes gene_type:complete